MFGIITPGLTLLLKVSGAFKKIGCRLAAPFVWMIDCGQWGFLESELAPAREIPF